MCGLLVWAGDQPQNPQIGRFLGTVWADSEVDKPGKIEEYIPSLTKKPEDKPGYAFLHPDSTPNQPAALKKPGLKARPLPRPQARKSKASKTLARK